MSVSEIHIPEGNHAVQANPKTRDGVSCFRELDSDIPNVVLTKIDEIHTKLQGGEFDDSDAIEYFFQLYYREYLSFEDISSRIENDFQLRISKRSLARWFSDHFGWEKRGPHESPNAAIKRSKSLQGNQNGQASYQRYREKTLAHVHRALKKTGIESFSEAFDISHYESYAYDIYRAQYLLTYFGYGEHPIDMLVDIHKSEIGFTAISTVINTLCATIIAKNNLDIKPPIIPRQTLKNRYKSQDDFSLEHANMRCFGKKIRININQDGHIQRLILSHSLAKKILGEGYNEEGMTCPRYTLIIEPFVSENFLTLASVQREFGGQVPILVLRSDCDGKVRVLIGSLKNGIQRNAYIIPIEGDRKKG